jgi:hypothetical protein
MKWKIEFQYKPKGSPRPHDEIQEDPLEFDGQFCPLPDVGDTVTYMEGDKNVARKVLTRHFSFSHPDSLVWVNIVVTDVPDGHTGKRVATRAQNMPTNVKRCVIFSLCERKTGGRGFRET